MSYTTTGPQIATLADKIATDIANRDLSPGDPYLSAAKTAQRFKVSGTAANRALQLLEKRGVLHRRQRVGAVIAEPSDPKESQRRIQRVHLVVQENYLRTEGLLKDGVLIGLQEALPGAELQFNFLPDRDEADYIQKLVNESLQSRQQEGFVLLRSSVTTQRILMDSGLPTVVHGQLHPSIDRVAQIDRDQFQMGQLLTEYLIRQRCSRLFVLLRETVSSGDHKFLDAVMTTCAEAGLRMDRLTVRCYPADPAAIAADIKHLMTKRKTGLICRTEQLADVAMAAVGDMDAATNCLAAVADVYRPLSTRFAYAASVITPEEFGRRTGHLLAEFTSTAIPEQQRIPVELTLPAI